LDKRAFQELLDKYLNGTATAQEIEWIEQNTDRFISQDTRQVFTSDEEREQVRRQLYQRIAIEAAKPGRGWWKAAASILLLLGLGLGFWLVRAPLTGPEMLEIATGDGQRKTIQLSDGSTVQLNAHSTLSYPAAFEENERVVKLSGEAFFSVAKDEKRPFVVDAGGIQTTVLGTEFNVTAYPEDGETTVSLVHGAVRAEGSDSSLVLEPGEQARFELQNGRVEVATFDPLSVTAWRSGSLVFNRTSFAQLARTMKRQFGLEVRFAESSMTQYTISGRFDDPQPATVLASVTAAKGLDYKTISGNAVLIYRPE